MSRVHASIRYVFWVVYLFTLYSIFGWVRETWFKTCIRHGRWRCTSSIDVQHHSSVKRSQLIPSTSSITYVVVVVVVFVRMWHICNVIQFSYLHRSSCKRVFTSVITNAESSSRSLYLRFAIDVAPLYNTYHTHRVRRHVRVSQCGRWSF